MNDLDDRLAGIFERLAEGAPHHPDLAGATRRRARRRRMSVAAGIAAASVAAAVTGLIVMPDGMFHDSKNTSAVAAEPPCESTITRAVLPEWARTGFSDPRPVMPFVSSVSGNVVAILFGDELASPARPDVANKVLWVWHQLPAGTTDIRASARLNGTGPAVTAGLPTPPAGPSYVDLPAPGCWRLTLTWPGGSDTIDLRALPPQDVARQP